MVLLVCLLLRYLHCMFQELKVVNVEKYLLFYMGGGGGGRGCHADFYFF